MRNKYIRTLLLASTAGCTAWATPAWVAENTVYHVVTIEKQLNSPSSPVGYWETSLIYPQLKQTEDKTLDSVNKQITALVTRYSCHGSGDQTFTAEPIYSNGHVLSFYYEAMWMCESMPSPDSTSGTASYNLETGESLSINKEFIDASSQKRFIDLANQLLTENLKKLPKDEIAGCVPFTNAGNVLITPQGLEMRGLSAIHGEPDCTIGVLIPRTELGSLFKPDSVLLK